MKLIKSLTVMSLSALMSFSAYAETAQKTPSKKAQQTHKAAQAPTQEQQLKKFSDNFGLRFMGIDISQANGQPIVNFNYALENKSKRNIKKVHWAAVYFYNNQPVLVQDMPISFDGLLKPNKAIPLAFSLPFNELPKPAQEALSTPNVRLSAQFQAKLIEFSNGSKIEVK